MGPRVEVGGERGRGMLNWMYGNGLCNMDYTRDGSVGIIEGRWRGRCESEVGERGV